MIKLLMLISFFERESRALKIFSSVKPWPRPFQVQYDKPSSNRCLCQLLHTLVHVMNRLLTPIFQPLWFEVLN